GITVYDPYKTKGSEQGFWVLINTVTSRRVESLQDYIAYLKLVLHEWQKVFVDKYPKKAKIIEEEVTDLKERLTIEFITQKLEYKPSDFIPWEAGGGNSETLFDCYHQSKKCICLLHYGSQNHTLFLGMLKYLQMLPQSTQKAIISNPQFLL